MNDTLLRYGNMSAKQLVELSHKEGGLWHTVCKKNNLLELFEKGYTNNSEYTIDLGEQLTGCSKEFYEEQLEFLNSTRNYANNIKLYTTTI